MSLSVAMSADATNSSPSQLICFTSQLLLPAVSK